MTAPLRRNVELQEPFEFSMPHLAVTTTTTFKLRKMNRAFVVTEVQYLSLAGLAEDATNWYTIGVKVGSNVICALADTDSDAAGADNSIAANTWIDGTLVTTAGYLNGAADDEITAVATKGGTQTLPIGTFVVKGFYTQPKL